MFCSYSFRLFVYCQPPRTISFVLKKRPDLLLCHTGASSCGSTACRVRVYGTWQGALIDQYGPGTVFNHIKQQRLRRRDDTLDDLHLTGTRYTYFRRTLIS